MKGDFHVQFRENAGVKFPCVTRFFRAWGLAKGSRGLKKKSKEEKEQRQTVKELHG